MKGYIPFLILASQMQKSLYKFGFKEMAPKSRGQKFSNNNFHASAKRRKRKRKKR